MAPLSIVLVEEQGRVNVYGVNDTDKPVTAGLRYGVFTLNGRYVLDRGQAVVLAPNASTWLADFPASAWTARRASLAFAVLTQGARLLARNRLFDQLFKDWAWPSARVRVKVKDGRATFTCDRFAWGVCLDLDGESPLDDNFFDIYPDQPHSIAWRSKTPPRVLHVGNELKALLARPKYLNPEPSLPDTTLIF